MKIDQVITQLESALTPDLTRLSSELVGGRCAVFSHRHAEELHAFGLTIEVDQPASDFGLLVLRVAVVCTHSEEIEGEVLWFKTRKEYGRSDCSITVQGFTQEGILEFRKEWPRLLDAVQMAILRKAPLQTS